MQKKVSIIIPFYKGLEWLGEAVQSLLDQTYDNIEIIVINDGSPEDVKPFLEKYEEKIVYRCQENQGAAVARNLGMSIATGDYIAFEDADDIWLPNKLKIQIDFMETYGFEWSHTGYYNWWPESGKMKRVRNSDVYDDISEQIKVSCHIATPSVIVSRKTMEEHPEIIFPPELRKGQDTAYYTQLSKYYKLALVEEPLVKVRMRGDNSFKEVLRKIEKRAKAYDEKKDNLSPVMKLTGKIYQFYYHMFGTKRGHIKEYIAKCFCALPYSIERAYLKKIIKNSVKDEKYILRQN